MPYDLFISYARLDNQRDQVAQLIAQIQSSFRTFAGREIRFFFDTQQIQGMDDWRQKIQRSLRESRLFLAVLSPNYISSPYCRWEWEDYVRYEAMRQCLGEGVAPVFFVTLPDAAIPQTDPELVRWMEEIHHRQAFDLRSWREHGEKALQEFHVQVTLEQLHTSVRERLERANRALKSPNNLIKHNAAFVGRVRELTDLRNALSQNKLGVVGAWQGKAAGPVAVQGLGGMGKTELALAYAHAFAWDYPGGRWQIPCEYTADLRLALTRLAGPMHFEFTEDEKKDLALQFERVLREIDQRERCLLILDNVSDPRLLEPEYFDRLPRDGHADLIATTRLAPASIPGSAQDLTFIAVDELPEEDALALMRSHQPEGRFANQDEENEARRIIQLFRGFTLVLETAAIYLGRHPAPDACRQFRERLSPDLLRESEQAATDPAVAVRHRVRSLDETMAFTLQTLTPKARQILDYASFLPPDQVAVPWLKALGTERFPAFQDNASPSFRQPVDLLLGLRLLQPTNVMDSHGQPLVVRIHRLVQELVRSKVVENRKQMHDAVVGLAFARSEELEKHWHEQDYQWEIDPLVGLTNQFLDNANIEAPKLVKFVCQWLPYLEASLKTEWLLRRALAQQQSNKEVEPIEIAITMHNLSYILQIQSKFKEAEALIRKALAIDEAHRPPTHPFIALRLTMLAGLLLEVNRPADAEPLMRRALDIDEANYGPDHPQVAKSVNNLAVVLEATNRPTEAETFVRRALDIDERTLGPDHPDVANRLRNLGVLLIKTNRMSEAEPLLRRALHISERCLGLDHPETAKVLNDLGQLLKRTKRQAEAEQLMRRALQIDEQNFGQEHPEVAGDINNLAQLLQATNRQVEAEPLMRRALAVWEKNLGTEHPKVAIALNNLAQLLQATNRQAEAESLMRRALQIDEKSFGQEHPEVVRDINNLAQLLQATNRLMEAESLMRQVLAIHEKSLGPDHSDTIQGMQALAALLETTGRFEEAAPLRQRALEAQERTFGSEHPDTLRSWNNHCVTLRRQGLAASAEPIVRRVAATTAKILGDIHPLTINRYANLALTLIMLGKLEEARQILTANWRLNAPPHANTTPRIAFLRHLIAVLESQLNTSFLGQLKTLLAGAELPVASEVVVPWDIAYFIEFLKPKIGYHNAEFLTALVATLNGRTKLSALEPFLEWRNQPPVPLDLPWP